MDATQAERMISDVGDGNISLEGSGSGSGGGGNIKNGQVHERHTNAENTRFESNGSGGNTENNAGYGKSIYSQQSRNFSQGYAKPAFNAYKAPNPDPHGYYAEAQRNLDRKHELRSVATDSQRPPRRQPYESRQTFEGVRHGLGSSFQPDQIVQKHQPKGMKLGFSISERQESNGGGKRPNFFSPTRTPATMAKDGRNTHENHYPQSCGQGNYLQPSVETESEEVDGGIAFDFARQSPTAKNRLAGPSQKREREGSEEDYDDGDEVSETTAGDEREELFVHPKGSGPYYRPNTRRGPNMTRRNSAQGTRLFEAVDVSSEDTYFQDDDTDPAYFPNTAMYLNRARSSGVDMPWASNRTPAPNQPKVTGVAALLKRGVDPKSDKKVLKRASGTNDPENITIVNLRDIKKMRFEEIAAYLNDDRIKKGLNPSLTTCGVNGRYNRTAPVLYRAQGMNFIPPAERRRLRNAGVADGDVGSKPVTQVWTPEMDVQLVLASKEYDKKKWAAVADIIEERTGVKVDETQCAVRFTTL